ncbi:distal membrane-arm assembly complex protein 1 [Microtus ochrogaster]|uniref:Distal membrane-arm assembly complex protein 1 n=1 Tax=Microtus ochrogaster TaxID=79684 RepID=A0ABM0KTU6_MICOH|nr:distal membrane-arm assembly complex protein 1 [Microtus ochrogaster]
MGSSLSYHVEQPRPSPAIPPAKPAAAASVAQYSSSQNCQSCRWLSGSALFGAGLYVYVLGLRSLNRELPMRPGPIAQMFFGVSIACLGAVILADPKKKSHQV